MKHFLLIVLLFTLSACGSVDAPSMPEEPNPEPPPIEDPVPPVGDPSIAIATFDLWVVGVSSTDVKISFWAEFHNDGEVGLDRWSFEFQGLSCNDSLSPWPYWDNTIMYFGEFSLPIGEYTDTTPPGTADPIFVYDKCVTQGMPAGFYEVTLNVYDDLGEAMATESRTFFLTYP